MANKAKLTKLYRIEERNIQNTERNQNCKATSSTTDLRQHAHPF